MADAEELVFDYYEDIWNVTFYERDVTKGLVRFVSPLLLLLGTVGNIFSVFIMAKLCREVLSTCVYLAILAAFDQIVLCIRCGNEWFANIADMDLTDEFMKSSTSACKAYLFAYNFVFHMYRWLIVCIAIEGFIAVRMPEKILRMCTLSRAKAIVLLLTVLLVCINIHYFWTFDLVDYAEYEDTRGGNNYMCLPVQGTRGIVDGYVKPTMDILVSEVLPLLIVGTCCVLIIIAMCRTSRDTEAYAADEAWRKRYLLYPYALQRLKVCILIVSLLFVFLASPKFIVIVVNHIEAKYQLSNEYWKFKVRSDLAMAICSLLEYSFLSMKFYIYFAACKQFRDAFFKFCRSLSCKARSAVIQHHNNVNQQERPLLPPSTQAMTSCDPMSGDPMTSCDNNHSNHRIQTLSAVEEEKCRYANHQPLFQPINSTEHTNV